MHLLLSELLYFIPWRDRYSSTTHFIMASGVYRYSFQMLYIEGQGPLLKELVLGCNAVRIVRIYPG
jgi:hypothetical protein